MVLVGTTILSLLVVLEARSSVALETGQEYAWKVPFPLIVVSAARPVALDSGVITAVACNRNGSIVGRVLAPTSNEDVAVVILSPEPE